MSVFAALPRPTKTYHTKTYDRISPTASPFDGKGKTVLVTGGSSGVGLSIARAFAEAGVANIVIVSRSPGTQEEASKALRAEFPNTEVQTIAMSITDLTRVSEVMTSVGTVDVLVLNAVVVPQHDPGGTELEPEAVFERTNFGYVIAPLHMIKRYLEQPSPVSNTVFNKSAASAHMGLPSIVKYGLFKAAFATVFQQFATMHTPENGVHLFSVHPGVLHEQRKASRNSGERIRMG